MVIIRWHIDDITCNHIVLISIYISSLFRHRYWVGNLVLSQKFGNFSRANATFSRLLFVVFQYRQTRSLCPCRHGTVWCTFLLKQNCAQTWPPWPKFATPFHANGFTFSSENLSDTSQYHTLFKTHFWWFLKKRKKRCGLRYRILTSGYPKRRFGLPWMFRVIFGVVWCSWR